MSSRSLTVHAHRAALKRPFTIARGSKTHAETVVVTLCSGDVCGRGESVPYARYGETVESVIAAIEMARPRIEAGISRIGLLGVMPAGAARCAVDCALWDLEAKLTGQPVWTMAGLPKPQAIETAETLSLDTPDAMADAARQAPGTLLKLKLGGPTDLERVSAVHAARPDARLIVDANEGLAPDTLPALANAAASLGVVMIEQPLPAGEDSRLERGRCPVVICADESVHTAADIPQLAQRYDAVNIKLDKTGGLTAALELLSAAQTKGVTTMVGCMVAGSLSMAPAVLLAQATDFADLDGPLWIAQDVADGLAYAHGLVSPPGPTLWGWPN